jgi:carotenoid cleavage dioxygenase-like enzyme
MSAAESNEVTNADNQAFLSGLWFPVSDERDVDACRVTGELPEGLRGSFMRNGPNQRFEPLGRYHMFDGDGMIHAIGFGDGKASYRNRWIRSKQLEFEMQQGRAVWYGLSELANFPDPEFVGDAGPIKNPANTHIIRHAGRYLALWEGGPPTEVDADLGTIGVHDFDGKLQGGMTAHPRLDPRTGEMFFFSYSVFPPYLRYHAVDAKGNLVHSIEIDIPHGVMMHDFAITEEHAIFLDSPIAFNFSGDNGPMVQWKPEYGTRLGVMPRLGQADEIKWYEVENGHVQHFWNAWVENGRIEISGTRLANPEFGMDAQEDIQNSGADAEAGRPTKYWVDLEKGTAGWEQFSAAMTQVLGGAPWPATS